MKNNKGITLIIVIITVILLTIIAGLAVTYGIDTYKNTKVIKFQAYMKAIQKKVDVIVEENVGDSTYYNTLGKPLTEEQKAKLQTIINSNSKIETSDVNEEKLRYFSASDIANVFELNDISDDIVVNFAKRDIISLNGVEKDNVMHYVEYTLH